MENPVIKARTFLEETSAELKRSSWPTKKELVDSTVMVIVCLLILGAFVAFADTVFLKIVQMLTGAA